MINFGFTANTAGIGQAGGNLAARCPVQRTDDMSGANAGFFGMLLALFARPVGNDQPIMPEVVAALIEGDAAGSETGQMAPAADGSGAPGTVIVSGDFSAPVAATEAPAGDIPGSIPGDTAPLPAGGFGTAGPLIHETLNHAGGVSDAAGPDIAVSPEGDSDEIDSLLAQVRSHRLKALQDSIKWATDLEPAGKAAGGDIPLLNTNRLGGAPGQPALPAADGPGNAALPALNMDPRVETEPQNRISGFFTNELFRAGADTGLLPRGRTLEAFARMAGGSEALRQNVLGEDTGQVTSVIPGQGAVIAEKANGISLTTANSESALASLIKMTSGRRVEPVMAREDMEDAFVFGAPQETALSGDKAAPAEDVWAKAVVSRVHEETVDAKAAGKTSVSFDITTESGEIVRVRVAMRNNLVSGRIGVANSGTREVLALHIPELNQRLEMENLTPERFDVYVMNGDREGGQRGQDRKTAQSAVRSDDQQDEDDFIYVSSEPKTFEKWA